MKLFRGASMAAALILPLTLTGCSLMFFRTRKLPKPISVGTAQTLTPLELVKEIDARWAEMQTLNATVEIQASAEKSAEGVARDYTTFRSIILLRKPGMLRVFGRVPVVGTTMFDMATDGSNFTLYVPSKSKAVRGANSMKKKSANQFENLRPDFFYDAMMVRGLDPEDNFSVTADSETLVDDSKKHLYIVPEYVINITRTVPGTREQTPVRSITMIRTTMLPYQQDFYDDEGNVVTHVVYSGYQDFGFGSYPGTITIRRPQEQFQLTLTIEKISRNTPLSDDQFSVKVPEGIPVQKLE